MVLHMLPTPYALLCTGPCVTYTDDMSTLLSSTMNQFELSTPLCQTLSYHAHEASRHLLPTAKVGSSGQAANRPTPSASRPAKH